MGDMDMDMYMYMYNAALILIFVTNRIIPAVGNSVWASATKGNGGSGDLEIDGLMEGEDGRSSDSEDSLARCGLSRPPAC